MIKVGDRIRILGFAPDADGTLPPSERALVGKEGVVTGIDDMGGISGTWGFLRLLPVDTYEVVEEPFEDFTKNKYVKKALKYMENNKL